MKMTKKVLSILLSLMLVLGAVAVGGMSASAAEEYNLWVGGVRVTDDNKDDVLGDGTVSYDPVSSTLTLNNATITGSYSNTRIWSSVSNLTIVLIGDNLIPNERGSGIFYNNVGKLTITGNGTLDVSGSAYSISSSGTLTIENASVVAKSDGAYSIESSGDIAIENATVISNSNGYYSFFSDAALTITNSYVSAEATNVCIFAHPLVLGEGLGITEPLGGQNSGKMITLNGQNVQKAVIQPPYSVNLSANPTECGTVSGGGLYHSGSTATVTATPNEHYNFVNWTENGDEVSTDAEYSFTVTGDRELVANFEIQKFTVQFVNYDGTELQSGQVIYGGTPAYTGEMPTKEATAQYTYSFLAWTPAIVPVTDDATYKATYTQTPREYEIKFVNEDGSELQSGDVAYGETPVYTGETPTKEQSDQYVYTFAGWSPEITSVTTDATYTATFTQAPRKYEIKFVNEDGTELQSGDVAYGETPKYTGETPTKTATAEYTYTFAGWSPEISEVTGEATYTATYTETPVDYKLTWTVDGESYKNETVPFGTEITKPDDPVKEGYTFEWVDDIPATMPAEDVTIKGEFTPIEYTAKFVDEDGNTVKEVKFTVKTEKLDEPAVPEKQGYAGEWEEYELTIGGITVRPVYANISSIEIEDYTDSSESGYREDRTFTVNAENLPEGAEIHWFVNGEDVGTGESYTVEDPTDDYTIQAKAVDKDGNTLDETQVQAVKVRNGFMDKLKGFFSDFWNNIFKAVIDAIIKTC